QVPAGRAEGAAAASVVVLARTVHDPLRLDGLRAAGEVAGIDRNRDGTRRADDLLGRRRVMRAAAADADLARRAARAVAAVDRRARRTEGGAARIDTLPADAGLAGCAAAAAVAARHRAPGGQAGILAPDGRVAQRTHRAAARGGTLVEVPQP